MSKTVKSIEISLLPSYADGVAVINIARVGQQEPYSSDNMEVAVDIMLPAIGYRLPDALRFNGRVKVADEDLYGDWGYSGDGGHSRYKVKNFVAPTWAQAEAMAEEWARGEVRNLTNAINARHTALLCAGN